MARALQEIRPAAAGDPGLAPKVSVVVPVAERCDDLVEIYRSHAAVLAAAGLRFEFLVVLDQGWEGAAAGLLDLAARGEPIRVIALPRRFGEATARDTWIAGFPEGCRGRRRTSTLTRRTPVSTVSASRRHRIVLPLSRHSCTASSTGCCKPGRSIRRRLSRGLPTGSWMYGPVVPRNSTTLSRSSMMTP